MAWGDPLPGFMNPWSPETAGVSHATRQAWRENHNDGQAAGLGAHLYPTSISGGGGSGSGSGNARVATGRAGGGTGPGSPRVSTGAGGRGSGSRLVISGVPWPQDPKKGPAVSFHGHDWFIPMRSPVDQEGRQFPFGAFPLEMNPYAPSAETIEEELGDTDFASPGWFAAWGAAAMHAAWNVSRAWDKGKRMYSDSPLAGVSQAQRDANARFLSEGFFPNPVLDADLPDPMAYQPMAGW